MALGHVAILVVEGEGEKLLPSYPLPTQPGTSMNQLVKKKTNFFLNCAILFYIFQEDGNLKKYIKY